MPEHFLVENYVLSSLGEAHALISRGSVVRIKDAKFADALKSISKLGREISVDTIDHIFSQFDIDAVSGRKFLEDARILRIIESPEARRLTNVDIVAESADHDGIANALTQLGISQFQIFSCADDLISKRGEPKPQTLVAVFLTNYSEKEIRNLYTWGRRGAGAAIQCTYYDGKKLQIGSLYYPDIGTPCHFCQVAWDERLAGDKGAGTMSALLRKFESAGLECIPHAEIYISYRYIAYSAIAQQIRQWLGLGQQREHLEGAMDRVIFDLDSLHVRRLPASHWPDCNCMDLEGDL